MDALQARLDKDDADARARAAAQAKEDEREAAAAASERSRKTMNRIQSDAHAALQDLSSRCQDSVAKRELLETDLAGCLEAARKGLAEGIIDELVSAKKACLAEFAETGRPHACATKRSLSSGDNRLTDGLKTCSDECRKEGPAARKDWLADQAAEKRRAAEEAAEARRRPASSSSSSSPAISDSCKKVLVECAQLVHQRGGSNAEMQGCVEQNGCARYLKK